jgi:hypothetical protein
MAYRTAIAQYISALRTRDGSFPDTVYIGKHAEFPSIALPPMIDVTNVRIIAPAEAAVVKNGDHFVYLNVFGWFNGDQVEFYVINFRQRMHHWPDGRDDRHLYFSMGAGRRELVLDSLRL